MGDAEQNQTGLDGLGVGSRIRCEQWPALEAVYRALVSEVWRFVHDRLGGDRHGADEVTSQVFLAVVENTNRFDPAQATIEAWVFGIARHKLADHLRGVYRDRRRRGTLEDHARTHARDSADTATAESVEVALERVPTAQRQILLWKYRDGLSNREIAQRLHRTEKACENLLARARHRFKTLYLQVTQ